MALAAAESSKLVDFIPFEEVEVVTFAVDVPLDFISLCRAEFFGLPWLWLWATVVAEPCDESKLELPLLRLSDKLLFPLSIDDGPDVTNDDALPLSRLDGPL